MPKPRAILKRAQSVRNVAKITNTMQMIATARFKKAFDRAVAARPYTDRLKRLISELSDAAGEFHHTLLEVRPPRKAAVIAVAGNRGLCGGYNSGVARTLRPFLQSLESRGLAYELYCAGKKLGSILKFQQIPVARLYTKFEDRPTFAEVEEVATPLMDRFSAGEIDELHVVYTKFLSASRQTPVAEQVLPLVRPETGGGGRGKGPQREYIFSPEPAVILSQLLPRSVRLHVFQAFLDAAVSEQTARMVAMKAATDNAHDMIRDLTRIYNRSRQAQITTELSEIMGGAAALE